MMDQAHILLLTGVPGVGKTTLICSIAELLKDRNIKGFYTEEIRKAGQRQGFRLVTFDEEEGTIAHVDSNSAHRVSKYGVDVATIDQFSDRVLRIDASSDLYLVDEIGKMECMSAIFIARVRTLLDADKPLVATIALRGAGFIDEVKQRSDALLWEVTRDNRDDLTARVLVWLGGFKS